MDTAGGAYAWPSSGFCYCLTSSSSGLSRCGCWEAQLWPADMVMPKGLSVLASHGTLGRFGIDPSETCPAGTERRDQGNRSECSYGPGSYVYAPHVHQGSSVAVATPMNAAQGVPGALSP
jgi:hypothetical protein